jgi:hypothetical protein
VEKRLAPYHEAMKAIEGAVAAHLDSAEGNSIRTDKGTAYRTTVMQTKVADRETFLDFVFDGRREGFLTNAVSKEAVREHMDAHAGALPPGIDIAMIHKCNFRKA